MDLHDPFDVIGILFVVAMAAAVVWSHIHLRKQEARQKDEEAARQAEAQKPVIVNGLDVEITSAQGMYAKAGDRFAGVVVRLPRWVDPTVWVAFEGQHFNPVGMGREYDNPIEALNALVKLHQANRLVGEALTKVLAERRNA